jgi:hypothetical protein
MTDKRTQKQADQSNMEKRPEDWTTGDEPMTGAQRSYLKTLSEEAKVPFDEQLTKAEASQDRRTAASAPAAASSVPRIRQKSADEQTRGIRRSRGRRARRRPAWGEGPVAAGLQPLYGVYFANRRAGSANALNSSALPLGSRKNIVACSPTSPLKRMCGSMMNFTPCVAQPAASASHSSIGQYHAEVPHRHVVAVDLAGAAVARFVGREVRDDLVPVEVEVDPGVGRAPFGTAEQVP